MKVRCTHDKLVPISELRLHPKNRNVHSDDQIRRLAQILEYQGFRYPVKVSLLSGYVTSGHGRIAAAKLNGWNKVPVNFQEYESEAQEYADLVADNSIASWAELDLDGIKADVGELPEGFNIDLLGLKDFEIAPIGEGGTAGEDEAPEPPKVAKTKAGELWLLGEHRLLCGDSTKREDVERLMAGEKPDFTITSPPYNVGLSYNDYDDSKSESDYVDMLKAVLGNIRSICSEDYWLLWNVGVYPLSLHLSLLREFFKVRRSIAWVKQGITGPPMLYHMKQNPVVKNYLPNFGWEIIACCHLNGELKGTKQIPPDVIEEAMTDVWQISQHVDSKDQGRHPGAFPVKIAERSILLYAENNVYEPFCGSGSTLIACEKTKRRCFGMEIDPLYCDVILTRFRNFSGKDPVRESDGVKWSELQGGD